MRELLMWVGDGRPYAEAIDVWRSNCPRLSVWDDALEDGLIAIVRGPSGSAVVLSSRGRALL
jgi:hypothetical protein